MLKCDRAYAGCPLMAVIGYRYTRKGLEHMLHTLEAKDAHGPVWKAELWEEIMRKSGGIQVRCGVHQPKHEALTEGRIKLISDEEWLVLDVLAS